MKKNYFRIGGNTLSVILSMICATPMFAQVGKTVQGTVTDQSIPLSGVMITEKGTDNHTFSDEHGKYQLTLTTDNAILIIETSELIVREEEVNNRTNILIDLGEEAIGLKEVVLNAGYYTVKDKERTGSIARVTAKEIENQPVNNVLDALQGRVAGLEITPTTGVAGGGYNIRLRGQNSIAAGNEPLFIIDGVPFDMNSMSYSSIANSVVPSANINPLNSLDPQSIESVEVLKDADATAIYGSRGANGVILITTKKGLNTKTKISLNSSMSLNTITRKVKMLNTEDYLNVRRMAFLNDGIINYPANAYDVNGTWDQTRYTDWQDLFFGNTGTTSNTKLNIVGGDKNTSFMIGANYTSEESVYSGDYKYSNMSSFINLNHTTPNQKLKLNTSIQYGQDKNNLPTENLYRLAKYLAPNTPALYHSDGSLNWENNTWNNPIALQNGQYNSLSNLLNASFNFQYNILKNVFFKSNFGYNKTSLVDIRLNPNTVRNPSLGSTSAESSVIQNKNNRNGWNIEPQLDYQFKNENHNLNTTIGATFLTNDQEQLVMRAVGFADNSLMNSLSAAKSLQFLADTNVQYKYAAFYARVNYQLNNKYIINLTGRRDGSSRFAPENRFSNFGAVGAAWIFSKESIFKNIAWLSFGKLRGSYGITGNDQIGDYQYLNSYKIQQDGYDGNSYLAPSRLYNSDFSWERNKKIDIALELGLLNNRVNFELNYYRNISDNQLIGYSLPATTGFSSIQSNLDATVLNKGFEIKLNFNNNQNNLLRWNSTFLMTIPQNKLLQFDGLDNSSYANRFVIGESIMINRFYSLVGVDQETGLFTFYDFNGDGKITAADDRKVYVDLNPKWYGSLSNDFQYKNWNLNFLFHFVKKKGYNEFHSTYIPGSFFNQPVSILNNTNMQNYSSGTNPIANTAFNNFYSSTGVISDASFIRLKSVHFSYQLNLPSLNRVNLYVQGHNLWTITKFKAGDPEQSEDFLPPLKRIAFGINVEF